MSEFDGSSDEDPNMTDVEIREKRLLKMRARL